MSAARDFKGSYGPGGLTTASKFRAAGRRGGIASGIRRRQLAQGRRTPHARSRAQALGLLHPVRQIGAEQFERLYRAMCEREGLTFDRRGLNTVYALYRTEMAAYRAQGQCFETTNGQRQDALRNRGRERCRRTVQRNRKRLEAMGLVSYEHIKRGYVKDGAWRAGARKDTLRVELLPAPCEGRVRRANVTPPSGAGTPCTGVVPANTSKSTSNDLSPPAIAGRDHPPDEPAERQGSERQKLEGRIRFQQMKLDCGLRSADGRAELHRLRMELRHLDGELMSPPADANVTPQGGSGQATSRIASMTWEGLR